MLFHLFTFILFEKQRDRQRSLICWFTLEMPTTARAGPGQSQEDGTAPRFPTWMLVLPAVTLLVTPQRPPLPLNNLPTGTSSAASQIPCIFYPPQLRPEMPVAKGRQILLLHHTRAWRAGGPHLLSEKPLAVPQPCRLSRHRLRSSCHQVPGFESQLGALTVPGGWDCLLWAPVHHKARLAGKTLTGEQRASLPAKCPQPQGK